MHYTTDTTTNLKLHWRVAEHIRKYDTLLEIVKRKVRWFGHVVGAKRTMERVDGKISRGRPARVTGRHKGIDRTELEEGVSVALPPMH